MDKPPFTTEPALLAAALDALRGYGLRVREVKAPKKAAVANGFVRLGGKGEQHDYVAVVKRHLRPATLGAALHQLDQQAEEHGLRGLLVADYITPEMAEAMIQQGREFLDAAGNAHIRQPTVLIRVTGRKPVLKAAVPQLGRAFQPTGLQVVFALLCHPEWASLPYRDLAAHAGVAHGTVGWVMPDLQEQDFVSDVAGKRGTRRLHNTQRLLGLWADAYARHLRPRTLLGRYYVPKLTGWEDWPLAGQGADCVQWGGEPAGALMTQYLRPGELTLYADKLPGLLAARQRFYTAPEPGHVEVVEVRKRFWNFPEDETQTCVPPVLVYADLMATGEARCMETGKMIYEKQLARLVEPQRTTPSCSQAPSTSTK